MGHIAATVKRNFYMDDCLKWVESERTAISHVKDLTSLLKKGGFHVTKWLSNSRAVMESIPTSERATLVKDLDFDHAPIEFNSRTPRTLARSLRYLWLQDHHKGQTSYKKRNSVSGQLNIRPTRICGPLYPHSEANPPRPLHEEARPGWQDSRRRFWTMEGPARGAAKAWRVLLIDASNLLISEKLSLANSIIFPMLFN